MGEKRQETRCGAIGKVVVSIVVPVYGSATAVPVLVKRLHAVLEEDYEPFEIICIDDCGPGDSWETLSRLASEYACVTCVQLMRNFGQHNALMCGFQYASGRLIVTMDDDLQHEPECVPLLLAKLEEAGVDLVYGVFEQKKHGHGRNLGSWLVNRFYRLIFRMPVTVTALRAMRRELVDAILRYDLNFTYIDGLLAWNTQRIAEVTVPHHERAEGQSGYTFRRLVSLAMNVFTNFSLLPLQVVSALGLVSSAIGLLIGVWYLVQSLLSNISVPGYASIIVAILFLGGLQLLSLGILGEYLGRLHLNVNRKPQYTIRQVLGSRAACETERRFPEV